MKFLKYILLFSFLPFISKAQEGAANSPVFGHDLQFFCMATPSGFTGSSPEWTGTLNAETNLSGIASFTLSNIDTGDIFVDGNKGIYEIIGIPTPGTNPVVNVRILNDPFLLGVKVAPNGKGGVIRPTPNGGFLVPPVSDGGAAGGLTFTQLSLIMNYNQVRLDSASVSYGGGGTLPDGQQFQSTDKIVKTDSIATFQKLVDQLRDSTIFTVPTVSDIDNISTPLKLGDRIIIKENGHEYLVQADSVAGAYVDGIFQVELSGKYAVNISEKLTVQMTIDPLSNRERLQNFIDYAGAVGRPLTGRDSFAIEFTSANNSIDINKSVSLESFKIKTLPDTLWHQDSTGYFAWELFQISGDQTVFTVNDSEFHGANFEGFTRNTSLLTSKLPTLSGVALDTENGDSLIIKFDGVNFYNSWGRGVQVNGTGKQELYWDGGSLEFAMINSVGAFGFDKYLRVSNITFNDAGYSISEVNGGQAFGPIVYTHPYVNFWFDGCRFISNHKDAFQQSSGSSLYETIYHPDTTLVHTQVIENCIFDKNCTDAVTTSWYYPHGRIEGCYFNNSGTGIIHVNSINVSNCTFSENTTMGILSSYPPLARNHNIRVAVDQCDFAGNSVITLDTDSGNSPIQTEYYFDQCQFHTRGGIGVVNPPVPTKDSSFIYLTIENSFIKSEGNNNFMTVGEGSYYRVANCAVEGARVFSVGAGSTGIKGEMVVENNIMTSTSGNVIFYTSASEGAAKGGRKLIAKNNIFRSGIGNVAYVYNVDQNAFQLWPNQSIWSDTLTATANISTSVTFNYDTYYIKGAAVVSNIFMYGQNVTGITDWKRYLADGATLRFINTETLNLSNTGNIDLGNKTSVAVDPFDGVIFKWNRDKLKWVYEPGTPDQASTFFLTNDDITYSPTGETPQENDIAFHQVKGEWQKYNGISWEVISRANGTMAYIPTSLGDNTAFDASVTNHIQYVTSTTTNFTVPNPTNLAGLQLGKTYYLHLFGGDITGTTVTFGDIFRKSDVYTAFDTVEMNQSDERFFEFYLGKDGTTDVLVCKNRDPSSYDLGTVSWTTDEHQSETPYDQSLNLKEGIVYDKTNSANLTPTNGNLVQASLAYQSVTTDTLSGWRLDSVAVAMKNGINDGATYFVQNPTGILSIDLNSTICFLANTASFNTNDAQVVFDTLFRFPDMSRYETSPMGKNALAVHTFRVKVVNGGFYLVSTHSQDFDNKLTGNPNDTLSISVNANAGTGASASLVSAESSDIAGKITVTSGTTLSAGVWATVTFDSPYTTVPTVTLIPNDEDSAGLFPDCWVTTTTAGFSLNVSNDATGAGFEATQYDFQYQVIAGK